MSAVGQANAQKHLSRPIPSPAPIRKDLPKGRFFCIGIVGNADLNPRGRGFDYKRKADGRTPVSRPKPANERSGASKCTKAFVAPHPFTRSNTKRPPEREVFLYLDNPDAEPPNPKHKKRAVFIYRQTGKEKGSLIRENKGRSCFTAKRSRGSLHL